MPHHLHLKSVRQSPSLKMLIYYLGDRSDRALNSVRKHWLDLPIISSGTTLLTSLSKWLYAPTSREQNLLLLRTQNFQYEQELQRLTSLTNHIVQVISVSTEKLENTSKVLGKIVSAVQFVLDHPTLAEKAQRNEERLQQARENLIEAKNLLTAAKKELQQKAIYLQHLMQQYRKDQFRVADV